ncbi:hypothetical protein CEXT_507091 [Caerostris extrusa]|uniref:Uncharacterized protein n=1 Tax=Caerostris extrusa TaxID=172846 RepID=A0AAV4URV3_CAEEX|nr:hypothetical protein CEXT_507091 [Caerostris extrusa]
MRRSTHDTHKKAQQPRERAALQPTKGCFVFRTFSFHCGFFLLSGAKRNYSCNEIPYVWFQPIRLCARSVPLEALLDQHAALRFMAAI